MAGTHLSHARWIRYASAAFAFRLADNMLPIASVLLLLHAGAPTWSQGAAIACATFPTIVASPAAGALIDRTTRISVVLFSAQVATALAIGGFWMLAHAGMFVWADVALIPIGVVSPLLTGGLSRVIRDLAGEDQLPRANTVDAVTMNAAQLSGPGVAAAAAAVLGASVAVLINAALAVLAAAAVWIVARGLRAAPHDEQAPQSRLAGLMLIAKDRRLLGATIASVAGYGASGALPIILPHYVRLLGKPSYAGGTLLTAFAVASLIGTLTTPFLQRRWGALSVVLVGEGLTGLLMVTWPLAATFGLLVVLVTAAGIADGPGLTAMLGVRQQRAPRSAYGRVVTAGVSLKVGAFALVAAITPLGISVFGVRGCLLCCAALQVAGVAAAAAVIAPRRSLAENRAAARGG